MYHSVFASFIKLEADFLYTKKKKDAYEIHLSPLNLAFLPVLISSLVTTLQYLLLTGGRSQSPYKTTDKGCWQSAPPQLLPIFPLRLRLFLHLFEIFTFQMLPTSQAPQTTPFITETPQPQHTFTPVPVLHFPAILVTFSILTYWLIIPKRMKA